MTYSEHELEFTFANKNRSRFSKVVPLWGKNCTVLFLQLRLSTFLFLWPWPWPDDLHVRTGPVSPGSIPAVQIWTSYVKAFESYRLTDIHRQTDMTEIIWHAAARLVRNDTEVIRNSVILGLARVTVKHRRAGFYGPPCIWHPPTHRVSLIGRKNANRRRLTDGQSFGSVLLDSHLDCPRT